MSATDTWFRGTSPAWREVERRIELYGPTRRQVVLRGPTGSGKTLVAELLHQMSGRPGPLVSCSLQGLPDSMAHGLLFGHQRGAFTGATRDHRGLVEQAHGRSLFLDEVHRASPLVQDLLVDVGDRRPIRRLGEERDRVLDVKLIYGTNAERKELVTLHGFAADLLFRFGYVVIRVPALAERREDILPMARHLLAASLMEEGKTYRACMTPGLERFFREYPWPGNARQLANVCVVIALHLDRDRPADLADLPEEFVKESGSGLLPASEVERIDAALERTGGNISEAARLIGKSRGVIYRRRKDGRTEGRIGGASERR